MPELTPEIYELGAVAIIFLFCVDKFFKYLKIRNDGNKLVTELALINQKLDNHIECITTELIQINASLRKNTDDTNEIKLSVAILKEKLR